MANTSSKAAAPKKAAAKPAKSGAADEVKAKKTATGKAAASAKSAAKPAAKKAAAPKKGATLLVINDEQRYKMIAEAAYYRAESCHFKSDPVRDWIEAERDIDLLLSED